MIIRRVSTTSKADALIDRLRATHGALLFHLSGGCCDGSAPMCYPVDDFRIGTSDIRLGMVNDANFFVNKAHYEYIKYSHITLDVTEGRGSSFSLEIPLGVRFIIKSRLFTDVELEAMKAASN